jgi:hypothetical protein
MKSHKKETRIIEVVIDIFCDKCGEKIDGYQVWDFSIEENRRSPEDTKTIYNMDLCYVCKDRLLMLIDDNGFRVSEKQIG